MGPARLTLVALLGAASSQPWPWGWGGPGAPTAGKGRYHYGGGPSRGAPEPEPSWFDAAWDTLGEWWDRRPWREDEAEERPPRPTAQRDRSDAANAAAGTALSVMIDFLGWVFFGPC